MHNTLPNSDSPLPATTDYHDGAFSHVPQAETDIPGNLPTDEQLAALRGLARRQAYELRYDDKLNILKETALKDAIEKDIAENPQAERGFIFVDLGNFKKANGENGSTQDVGDDVLRTFVSLFRRESDLVGRLGGDEFAAYIDLTNRDPKHNRTPAKVMQDEVKRITDIRQAVIEKHPFLGEGKVQFFVGAGGVQYDPRTSYETNRQMANIEMGLAKEKGHGVYGKYRTEHDVA